MVPVAPPGSYTEGLGSKSPGESKGNGMHKQRNKSHSSMKLMMELILDSNPVDLHEPAVPGYFAARICHLNLVYRFETNVPLVAR